MLSARSRYNHTLFIILFFRRIRNKTIAIIPCRRAKRLGSPGFLFYNFSMRKKIQNSVVIGIFIAAQISNAFAIDRFDRVGGIANISGGEAEFKNSNRQNRLLIEVNVLSGVMQKGIHQVPDNTNLVDMITLAGGPEENADISSVHIKRRTKGGFAALEYNLEDIVKKPQTGYPPLEDGDVLMIDRSSSQKWISGISIVGISLGIIVSGFIIRNELNRKN